MNIDRDLTDLVRRAMRANAVDTQLELADRSGVASSQISRLLNGKLTGLTLTEATWEAIWTALCPAIEKMAKPHQLPRSRWLSYLEGLDADTYPPEIRELAVKVMQMPPEKQALVLQVVENFQPSPTIQENQ